MMIWIGMIIGFSVKLTKGNKETICKDVFLKASDINFSVEDKRWKCKNVVLSTAEMNIKTSELLKENGQVEINANGVVYPIKQGMDLVKKLQILNHELEITVELKNTEDIRATFVGYLPSQAESIEVSQFKWKYKRKVQFKQTLLEFDFTNLLDKIQKCVENGGIIKLSIGTKEYFELQSNENITNMLKKLIGDAPSYHNSIDPMDVE
eukprot:NODE_890_length_3281_cov_0.434318.p2 type:complete len:208 gc:universal NODE_890_length_3281_cov_0.434318:2804-2181(-)